MDGTGPLAAAGPEELGCTLAAALEEHALHDEAARQLDFTFRLGNDDNFYVCIALLRNAFQVARAHKNEQAAAFYVRADIHRSCPFSAQRNA